MKQIRKKHHGARRQSKNDTADRDDNLFQLTTSAWVSDSRSEKRKESRVEIQVTRTLNGCFAQVALV